MKRLIILAILYATCGCSGVRGDAEPVQPLSPPRPEAEAVQSPTGLAAANNSILAAVNVPLPPPEKIPVWRWEEDYFKEINARARFSRLLPLKSKIIAHGDLEVRIWSGFGLTLLQGTILERTGGRWSAKRLAGAAPGDRRERTDENLPEPTSGWERLWAGLQDAGVLILPSVEKINCPAVPVSDGFSYVLEYKVEGEYRTYMYDNPDMAACDEAKRMTRIIEIIIEEFPHR